MAKHHPAKPWAAGAQASNLEMEPCPAVQAAWALSPSIPTHKGLRFPHVLQQPPQPQAGSTEIHILLRCPPPAGAGPGRKGCTDPSLAPKTPRQGHGTGGHTVRGRAPTTGHRGRQGGATAGPQLLPRETGLNPGSEESWGRPCSQTPERHPVTAGLALQAWATNQGGLVLWKVRVRRVRPGLQQCPRAWTTPA